MGSTYAALFSGGKDSYLALRSARQAGHSIDRLVTVDAPADSYLYHAPATMATPVIADALGLEHELLRLDPADGEPADTTSSRAARREVVPLESWLDAACSTTPGLAGLVTGAVASSYQYDRLTELCAKRDLDLIAPLWGAEGDEVLDAMLEASLAVDVVAVAADGLDESWLGRRLDADAVAELEVLADEYGLHPAGEGGEFETLVVDAPAFDAPLSYEATSRWMGTHGVLELESIGLQTTVQ